MKAMWSVGAALTALAIAASPSWSADAAPTHASRSAPGKWHFNPAWIDSSVNPGDSFFRYAQGNWVKQTEIPADKSSYNSFSELQDLTNEQVRTILEAAATAGAPQGSVEQKVGDYYRAFMNQAVIEARGLKPLAQDLTAIDAIASKVGLARHFGEGLWNDIPGPVNAFVTADARHNSRYTAVLVQHGLGLPSRDYYVDESNPRNDQIRSAYRAHIANMLRMAGQSDPEARANAVFELEKKIAETHWPLVDLRNADKTYNRMSRAELAAAAPGFDWPAFLQAAGVGSEESLVVGQPSAMVGAARLVASEPLETWKDYLKMRTLSAYASVLPKAFVDENFAFYGKKLGGTPQLQERWKRGLNSANGAIGQAVGQLYVARYFPPEAKAKMNELVRNIIEAMGNRIARLSWMEPETKVKARAKLAAFNPMIGYPDTWRDYSKLEIAPDDALGNLRRANRFEHQRILDRLGQPVDRNEWFMNPQTVNAYASLSLNQIVFPAAHLQPPFFDPDADDAVNYGGIGIGIGHEISHHFDDQGRKFDASGELKQWWTDGDVKRFNEITARLVEQFSGYEPLPGYRINGQQTLGENIADLAGLLIAYDGYKIALGGKPAPVINGFTGDQRFFLGFTRVWRGKYRDSALQQQLKAGVHTPVHFRSNAVRNVDAWYDAFNVKGGELYLPPDERVRLW